MCENPVEAQSLESMRYIDLHKSTEKNPNNPNPKYGGTIATASLRLGGMKVAPSVRLSQPTVIEQPGGRGGDGCRATAVLLRPEP